MVRSRLVLALVALALTASGEGLVAVAHDAPHAEPGTSGRVQDGDNRRFQPAYVQRGLEFYTARPEPRQQAPFAAQTPLYQVSYPPNFRKLGLREPFCAPCDHQQNGIDTTDVHDHVLSERTRVGQRTRWRVYGVDPAYTGQPDHDSAVSTAYAKLLPARSQGAINRLLTTKLPDGAPVATLTDFGFYFVGSRVSASDVRGDARRFLP